MSGDGVAAHRQDLAEERAVNERYLREVRALVARMDEIAGSTPRPRNEIWAGAPIKPAVRRDEIVAPLIGRVALDADDEWLGDGFYVGAWHQQWDGTQVVSWAAPVARLFYQGPGAPDELAGSVLARRTFTPRVLDIIDLVDDIDRSEVDRPFDRRVRRRLDVPSAPGPVARPTPRPVARPAPPPAADPPPPRDPGPAPRPAEAPAAPAATRDPVPDRHGGADPRRPSGEPPARRADQPRAGSVHAAPPAATQPPSPKAHAPDGRPAPVPLRAERAVRQAIERPRTGRLSSVLATLQPDQFRLVTWPAERPLVVQGQPGTGKTVVATHRAAYLTHPERKEERLGRVGFVGPTAHYVEHVTGALRDLDVEEVHLLAVPQLLVRLAGLSPDPVQHGHDALLDTEWKLARVAQRAAAELKDELSGKHGRLAKVGMVVRSLVARRFLRERVAAGDSETGEWIAGLQWGAAQRDWRFAPFLAAIGLALFPPQKQELFDHIIVDEAQLLRITENAGPRSPKMSVGLRALSGLR